MMTKKNLALALAMVMMSAQAFAEETSTTSVQAVAPKLTDSLVLSYTGYMYGPRFSGVDSNTTDGDRGSQAINIDSTIKGGYKLNKDVTLAGNFRWISQPVRGEGSYLKDPWLSIGHSHFIQRGNLNSAWDLRMYLPVTTGSQARDLITAFRANQNTTYTVGDLTAGVYTYVRADVTGTRGTGGQAIYLYAAPNAALQVSKTVAATMWIDLAQFQSLKGDSFDFKYDPAAGSFDVEPGVSWDITDKINVNPYLNFYPANMKAETTTINMILSAKVL